MRKVPPVRLLVCSPQTKDAREELARRVARIHADAVIRQLDGMNCPSTQKQALLNDLIAAAEKK